MCYLDFVMGDGYKFEKYLPDLINCIAADYIQKKDYFATYLLIFVICDS